MTENVTDDTKPSLSTEAGRLLELWREGVSLADSKPVPSKFVFSDHAHAYLKNAGRLAGSGDPDFAIFGALFCLRHGLELWLKCLVRNHQLETFLAALIEEPSVEPKAAALRAGLREKFATTFNVGVAKLAGKPKLTVSESVVYLRDNPVRAEDLLMFCVNVQSVEHGLIPLLGRLREDEFDRLVDEAMIQHRKSPTGEIATAREVRTLIELLDFYDPDGDAFRYPMGLDGRWHSEVPPVSLRALANSATRVASLVKAMSASRSELDGAKRG